MRIAIAALLGLSACTMGYWPKVEGDTGAQYQSDVRECQTINQDAGRSFGSGLLAGGLLGAAFQANDSQSPEGKAAINNCMTKRGYHVQASN